MSLDVYLTLPDAPESVATPRIFIREDGQTKEITRADWDALYPDCEPVTATISTDGKVYTNNITHNLNTMAQAAGLYRCLWYPDEEGCTYARELIVPLSMGLAVLTDDPERFMLLEPDNGWGTYQGLVRFCAAYLAACIEYPDAEVSVWR